MNLFNKYNTALLLGMLLTLPFIGSANAASFCKDKASDFFDKLASNVCDQIDTKPLTMEQAANSPYGYKSPDAGCDLGLSMPGLPGFGFGMDGLDSCKILKAVTGDMVDKANTEMQNGLDAGLEAVKGDTQLPSNVDLNEIVGNQVKQPGSNVLQ